MGQFNIDNNMRYFIVEKETLQIGKWYIRCYKEKSEKDSNSVIINRDIIKITYVSWRETYCIITYTKLSLSEGKSVLFQSSISEVHTDRDDNLIYYLSGGVEFTLEELTEENTIGFIRGLLGELLGTTISLKYINSLLSVLKKNRANVDLDAVTVKEYLIQHENTLSSLKGKYLKMRENDRGCTKYFQIRDIRRCWRNSDLIRVFYILLFSIEDDTNEVEYPNEVYISGKYFFDSTIITKKEFNEARNNKKSD